MRKREGGIGAVPGDKARDCAGHHDAAFRGLRTESEAVPIGDITGEAGIRRTFSFPIRVIAGGEGRCGPGGGVCGVVVAEW